MIKHVVMWNIRDRLGDREKPELIRELKERLESLRAVIPEIEGIEVGVNEIDAPAACDVCLNTVFKSWEALDVYRQHPEHQKVVAFAKTIVTDRHVVDYSDGG